MGVAHPVALLSYCILAAATLAIQTNAFWFTDSSLFQQPVDQIAAQFVETPQAVAQQTPSSSQSASAANSNQRARETESRSSPGVAPDPRGSAGGASNSPSGPWVQLTSEPGSPVKRDWLPESTALGAQDQANGFVSNNNNNSACQCDPGWLESQTGAWLTKWLGSAQFASQMKSLGLAGPAGATPRGGQAPAAAAGQNPNGNARLAGLAWSKPSGKRSERNGHASRSPAHQRTASGTPPAAQAARRDNVHRAQQPAVSAANLKVLQGERGPKGDQGERGPSGMISVRHRDALFDLLPASVAGGGAPPRLVFVESEQLLVLETAGPSWRPVPLLAPLHDFRKTIAKFNLNSAEDRRRLLQATSDGRPVVIGQDGATVAARTPVLSSKHKGAAAAGPNSSVSSATEQLFERAVVKSKSILGTIDAAMGRAIGATSPTNGANHAGDAGNKDADEESDDEEDDDDDDDDDDDHDDDDDLNMEDEPDEPDGDANDDDEPDNEIGARERPSSAAGRGARVAAMPLMTNKIPTASAGVAPKRARSQVASRSAMSANSISSVIAHDAADQDAELAEEGEATLRGNAMKLRLVALNEPFSGNQHGLRGANFECKRNAARAGVKGAFRALLATSYQNLNEIVRYSSHVQKYPIVNLRGDTLASSWHDLFRAPARAINPLSRIQSFDGRHVASDPNWPNKLVWLGTGSKLGHRDSASHNCDGWHSDSLSKVGFATPLHSPRAHHRSRQYASIGKHSQQKRFAGGDAEPTNSLLASGRNSTLPGLVFDVVEKYPCRMPLIVLCIETVAQTVD